MPEHDPAPIAQLLGLFHEHTPQFHGVRAEHIPEPYHTLLCHDWDMTPTLAEFHHSPIALRVLDWDKGASTISRRVVLLDNQQNPLVYGVISFYLDHLSDEAARRIKEGVQPLGTIMEELQLDHRCRPRAFFKVTPDLEIREALYVDGHQPLFGRLNRIFDSQERKIAEVVEILPPIET